jgi:hypothetical protein
VDGAGIQVVWRNARGRTAGFLRASASLAGITGRVRQMRGHGRDLVNGVADERAPRAPSVRGSADHSVRPCSAGRLASRRKALFATRKASQVVGPQCEQRDSWYAPAGCWHSPPRPTSRPLRCADRPSSSTAPWRADRGTASLVPGVVALLQPVDRSSNLLGRPVNHLYTVDHPA